jgi:hypothetical protein
MAARFCRSVGVLLAAEKSPFHHSKGSIMSTQIKEKSHGTLSLYLDRVKGECYWVTLCTASGVILREKSFESKKQALFAFNLEAARLR